MKAKQKNGAKYKNVVTLIENTTRYSLRKAGKIQYVMVAGHYPALL
jgi:hypothetical protein